MRTAPALHLCILCGTLVTQVACGGSGDPDIIPTGAALPNLVFVDNDGYLPLDKLKADGSFYQGNESDFGATNPAYAANRKGESKWAIDSSASVPAGNVLRYSFKVEGVNAGATEVANLTRNLKIQPGSGLITQSCTGYPDCFDNQTAQALDFRVTVRADVEGNGGSLTRQFVLRVQANN